MVFIQAKMVTWSFEMFSIFVRITWSMAHPYTVTETDSETAFVIQ